MRYNLHVWPPLSLPHFPSLLTGAEGVGVGTLSSSQGVEVGLTSVDMVEG
jgi:hypothetical protein